MPMPDSWIDRIFDKLTMIYGHQFLGRWSGLDLSKVKGDWAHELDGMEAHPKSIAHALQHLDPNSPPTVLQFREMCRRAPDHPTLALDAPKPDQAVIDAALQQAREAVKPQHDVLFPIRQLMWREIDGDRRLTQSQRDFWRVALHGEIFRAANIDTKQKFDLDQLAQRINYMRFQT